MTILLWVFIPLVIVLLVHRLYQENKKSDVLQEKLLHLEADFEYLISKRNKNLYELELPKVLLNKSKSVGAIITSEMMSLRSEKLPKTLLAPRERLADRANYFYGRHIVIAGDFDLYPSTTEIATWLWEIGATIETSLSPQTHYFLVGKAVDVKRLRIAKVLEVTIIDEAFFQQKFPERVSRFMWV